MSSYRASDWYGRVRVAVRVWWVLLLSLLVGREKKARRGNLEQLVVVVVVRVRSRAVRAEAVRTNIGKVLVMSRT